jgi:hypothetical protein
MHWRRTVIAENLSRTYRCAINMNMQSASLREQAAIFATYLGFMARAAMVIMFGLAMQQGCKSKDHHSNFISDGIRFEVIAPADYALGGPSAVGMTGGSDKPQLTINGRDYGSAKSGDSVVVDLRTVEPQVTVNGTRRIPAH